MKKYRGKGYGWQTDEEFERSRAASDAARPGCYAFLIVMFVGGFILNWIDIKNETIEGVLSVIILILAVIAAFRA